MALPSGLEMAAIVLLTLALLAGSLGLFWAIVRVGESDGDEKWATPPIHADDATPEDENR